MSVTDYQSVLNFWFIEPSKERKGKIWFGGGADIDAEIKEKFGDLVVKARNGELSDWENLSNGPKAGMAFIILLDQFCRNIYRGTTDMYSHDAKSLAVALKIIDSGVYKEFSPEERFFLYLPLEHHESIEMQAKCVALYEEFEKDGEGQPWKETASGGVRYSKQHQEIVVKYGRFPKRNAILGRQNTPQEEEDLKNWPFFF